jgi:regulator of sigma E protease
MPEPKSLSPAPEEDIKAARRNAVFNWLLALAAIVVFSIKFPSAAQTLLFFVIVLGVLVFVHEWGHYQFARWAGMKVNRFGIGFPPWIYTKRYKGVDYSIGALPVGGMVDIAGLGSEEEMVATAKGESNEQSLSQRAPRPDAPFGERLFQDSRLGWRFLTLFAGPLMNFIFALVLFIALFSIWGAIDYDKSHQINVVSSVRLNAPADKAGLRAGDKIVGINDIKTDDTAWLAQTIRDTNQRFAQAPLVASTPAATVSGSARAELGSKPIEPITLSVVRDGKTIQKTFKPTVQDLPILTASGITSFQAPAIGVEFDQKTVRKKVSVTEAMQQGVLMSVGISYQIVRLIGRAATFRLNKEETRSIGGPVKIAQEVGKSARDGYYDLALLAAALSVNLGLMNLLPFPALDGGRILFLGYELVFRKPIDARKESFVHMIGMFALLAFMLFITINDVLPWIQRGLQRGF